MLIDSFVCTNHGDTFSVILLLLPAHGGFCTDDGVRFGTDAGFGGNNHPDSGRRPVLPYGLVLLLRYSNVSVSSGSPSTGSLLFILNVYGIPYHLRNSFKSFYFLWLLPTKLREGKPSSHVCHSVYSRSPTYRVLAPPAHSIHRPPGPMQTYMFKLVQVKCHHAGTLIRSFTRIQMALLMLLFKTFSKSIKLILFSLTVISGSILCGARIYLLPGDPVHVHVTDDVLHDQHARRVVGNERGETDQNRGRTSCGESI